MSVTEIGLLHGRFVRLSDRFKAIWTYHQFAAGVFKNFLEQPLPYEIDFQTTYDKIKKIGGTLNAAQIGDATTSLNSAETQLERASALLLAADDQIVPSIVRRFFEKLKRQDENIIQYLIKFFLYADAVEGDRRDKVDFLITRIGEDFIADRGEYWSRDSLEFREKIIALVSILRTGETTQEEVVRLIRAIRSMRDEVQAATEFEQLTDRHLLKNARLFKHRIGDLYFHPDILLAIVELNVSTKNRFLKLYREEEQRILEDSQKLMDYGLALERNFGNTNPELVEEIARFREFKERFDDSRAHSNVKHDTITQLKTSMGNILAQLDKGLGAPEPEDDSATELPQAFFTEAESVDNIDGRFGNEPVLRPFLVRIAGVIDSGGIDLAVHEVEDLPAVKELRLESWEVASYLKMFERLAPETEEDNDELWMLYLRAAALRIKVDEEATIMATALSAGVHPEAELLAKAKASLDTAKELDELFAALLQEAVYYSNPKILHQLYRSRFRLLRGFSGLWLIYDRQQ